MNAVEHMIAWIESSYPHYQRLLQLEQTRKSAGKTLNAHIASEALSIVGSAYREATRGGDMFAEDQSPETLLDAARALLAWEMEESGRRCRRGRYASQWHVMTPSEFKSIRLRAGLAD